MIHLSDLQAASGGCVHGAAGRSRAIDRYPAVLATVADCGIDILLVHERVPLAGRVTMDQAMIDVSHFAGVRQDDEALLIGSQGDDRISPRKWPRGSGRSTMRSCPLSWRECRVGRRPKALAP